MTEAKKPDESKKNAATAEEKQDELTADELEQVAGGVLNLGGIGGGVSTAGNVGSAQVKQAPAGQVVSFDPNIIPTGGTSE
jgi:hypothetical protein